MPENDEVQAQTDDLEDEYYVELASKLPMSSEEQVRLVEDKLSQKNKLRLILKSKNAKGGVDGVLRGMFSDDLMYHYNLEGRKKRESILKLKCVGFGFDIFADKNKNTICGELQRFVALSHN
ncbi:PREDICTED: uncharacterized protein LOC108970908, partial [Bactrocera latifrons]|uniref:uncharacterized protein LOC108970908 n=1 Tax=Bactrocera latifrons TaxID=174628 RepID=UPI0008DE66B6